MAKANNTTCNNSPPIDNYSSLFDKGFKGLCDPETMTLWGLYQNVSTIHSALALLGEYVFENVDDDIVLDLTALLQVMSKQCKTGVSSLSDKYEHGLIGKAPKASGESEVDAAQAVDLAPNNEKAAKPEEGVSIDPGQPDEIDTNALFLLIGYAKATVTLLVRDIEAVTPANPSHVAAAYAAIDYLDQMERVLDSGEKRS